MRITYLFILLVLILSQSSYAEVNTSRQLAEELLVLTEAKKNLEKSFDMIKQMQMARIKNTNLSGEDAQNAAYLQEEVMNILEKEMSWDNLKEDYIDIYAEIFTEEELQGIIAFYKTPIGRKFIERTPEVMQKSFQISQKQMALLMPKIQKLIQEKVEAYEESEKEFKE